MNQLAGYEGRFASRSDGHHVLAQLPPVGGPEKAHPLFVSGVEGWRPRRDGVDNGGIVLLGPTGTGKTTALVHLARFLLAKLEVATSSMFVLASELAENRDQAERAKNVRFLFLDDVGKERDPHNRLFQVLDYRHTRYPTFISTGLNFADLDSHYDGATVRRIFEFRGARVKHVSTFVATAKILKVRPPGDQEELERRFNGGAL